MFYIIAIFVIIMTIFFVTLVKSFAKMKLPKNDENVVQKIYVKDNSEKIEYLIRCFLWNEKNMEKNKELILILDGCTDETKKICEIYAKKYDFIKIHYEDVSS